MYFSGVEVCSHSGHSKNKPDVPDPVIEHCLEGCCVCVRTCVSSPNKKERHNADTLSADEQLEYVVGRDQNNHRDKEGEKIFEKSVYIGVRVHIPGGEL